MRPVPPGWHAETVVCGIRGHVAPAAHVRHLRPPDAALGADQPDGSRLSRCLRCDAWVRTAPPSGAAVEHDELPLLRELPLPRRGKGLDDAIVVRLIACERAIHMVLFSLLAAALLVLDLDIGGLREAASDMAQGLADAVGQTGRAGGHSWLADTLADVADAHEGAVRWLLVASVAYAVVEGVEAVGLWRERRWAEYLTVVATAGFLPLELHELLERVTPLRVVLLAINVAVLVYLIWAKRLFGLRGGAAALRHHVDWDDVLAAGPPPVEQVVAP